MGWVALTVACTVVLKLLYTIPAALRALPQLRLRFHMPSGPEFKEMAGFSVASLLGSLGFLFFYASSSSLLPTCPSLEPPRFLLTTWVSAGIRRFGDRIRVCGVFDSGVYQPSCDARSHRPSHFFSEQLSPCTATGNVAMPAAFLLCQSVHDPVGRKRYASESSQILQLAILNVLISVPAIVGYEALVGLGRIGGVAWAMVAGGIFNIVLGVVLSGTFGLGIVGVAISMLVSYSGGACSFILWSAMREVDVSFREFLSQVVIAPVSVWLACGAIAIGLQLQRSPFMGRARC